MSGVQFTDGCGKPVVNRLGPIESIRSCPRGSCPILLSNIVKIECVQHGATSLLEIKKNVSPNKILSVKVNCCVCFSFLVEFVFPEPVQT